MIKSIQYDAVNWVDGMKVSQKHFDAQTNFILEGLRDVRATSSSAFSYGLLPSTSHSQGKCVFEVFPTISGDLELVMQQCNAITPSGFRIDCAETKINIKPLIPSVGEELQQQKSDYYLILIVDPFDKVPFGSLQLEESPPRYPYTKAKYRWELIAVSMLNSTFCHPSGGDYVIVCKIMVHGDIIQLEETYIPPCTSVLSHPVLLHHYNRMGHCMPLLEKYAVKILQKESNTKQNTRLMRSVKLLCQVLVQDIGSGYFYFRNIVPHQAPLYFIGCFSQIATHLYQVTQTLLPADLEEVLNYISEWSEIPPHAFLNQLTTVAEITYQHWDCATPLGEIQTLMSTLELIFLKLNELDYIGQRKENIIVNEFEVTPIPKTNRGWSVLD
ncbi:hypothetical protein [Myroides sp. DW712]|uniref:hypothetical protein n=1 Tax=Myroides sp. DW712 TaxID=3389800 RepID=UPI00397D16E1